MSFTNMTTPEKLYYDMQVSNVHNNNCLPPNLTSTRNTPPRF